VFDIAKSNENTRLKSIAVQSKSKSPKNKKKSGELKTGYEHEKSKFLQMLVGCSRDVPNFDEGGYISVPLHLKIVYVPRDGKHKVITFG
jgi:hypothetical protein